MRVIVSPYHLSSREPPAMAALLLATDVLTMLPRPGGGKGAFIHAAASVPGYLRFIESLEWSRPLWDHAVIHSTLHGREAGDDIRRVSAAIERDPYLLELRAVMRPGIFDDDERSLNALAADILKGGPDPAVSVPIAAGLDRFAAIHRLLVARAAPFSVAQRAEANIATPLFAFAAPVFTQVTGDRMLEAREELDKQLTDLRAEIERSQAQSPAQTPDAPAAKAKSKSAPRPTGAPHGLKLAADAYAAAFDAARTDLTRPGDRDDPRTVAGVVTLSFVRLPVDAVVASSLAALRSLSGGRSRVPPPPAGTLLAERDEAAGLEFTAIVVKLLGKPGR